MSTAERVRAWHVAHPDRIREIKSAYRERNREKLRLASRVYDAANPERYNRLNSKPERKLHLKKYRAAKHREKQAADPEYRITASLRARTRLALAGVIKSGSTISLIGCSAAELRQHLARQFLPGMTWENYGRNGWHIDHIRPCASFDLLDPAEQSKCFHFSNLQPLWASENIRKGAKR